MKYDKWGLNLQNRVVNIVQLNHLTPTMSSAFIQGNTSSMIQILLEVSLKHKLGWNISFIVSNFESLLYHKVFCLILQPSGKPFTEIEFLERLPTSWK